MCVRKSDYCLCLITLVSDRNSKFESFNYGTVVLPLSIQSTLSKPNTKSKEGKERHQSTKQRCPLYIVYPHTSIQYTTSRFAADSQPALNRNGGRDMAFYRICCQHQALVCGDLRNSIERILGRRCFYDCVLHHRIARKALGLGTKL